MIELLAAILYGVAIGVPGGVALDRFVLRPSVDLRVRLMRRNHDRR